MKLLTYLLLLPFFCVAQVGINTTTPQKTLHVAGQVRVDTLPLMASNYVVVPDADGNLGKATMPTGSNIAAQIVTQTANGPVDRVLVHGQITMYEDLGLNTTVTVAPNSTNILNVTYFLPAGVITTNTEVRGYLGATFFKNGVPIPNANTKFSIPKLNTGNGINGFEMGYLTNSHTEIITNTGTTPQSYTFEVKGYIEQLYSLAPTVTYRFNMWSAAGQNYNWGKAYIRYQLIRL